MNHVNGWLNGWLRWLLPFAAIALVLGWETEWGQRFADRPVPDTTPTPPPVSVALMPEFALAGGLGARRETIDRTLFNPTRRPAPAALAEQAKSRMQRGQFLLTGTAVVDSRAIAFLREVNGGKARSARAGETINGMTIAEVRPDRVRLVLGDESEELVLRVATGPKATLQAVPAQGAPAAANPAAPLPGAPAGTVQPPGAETPQTLLERRRAARAAAQSQQEGAPAPAAPAAAPITPPPAGGAAQPALDPRWGQMDRAYQERAAIRQLGK